MEYVVKKAFRGIDNNGKSKVYMPGEHIIINEKTPPGLMKRLIEAAEFHFVVEANTKRKKWPIQRQQK